MAGTLIIVSHDIDFLEPIVTKVIEVRGSKIQEYYGGIEYYLMKKDEYLESEFDQKIITTETKSINRKEEKRLQAEKRQQEHFATKDLKKNIFLLEQKIEELETNKMKLEADLIKKEIYSNPILAKQNKIDYDNVKEELEQAYTDWTNSTDELERITENLSTDD